MAFEQADFGDSIRFDKFDDTFDSALGNRLESRLDNRLDGRLLGSVGSAPHIQTGPAPRAVNGRPQLSLVPDAFDYVGDDTVGEEDQWQERALCAQTDPEAFFPEKGGSTREAKRICQGCEVKDACLEYALANDERFGIWGGLSERERRRLKRGII